MLSSAEIALLYKISELAKRYGMKPSEANASIDFVHDNDYDSGRYELSFMGPTVAKEENYFKMVDALGVNKDGVVAAQKVGELEDIVDQALSLAPRVRSL